MRRTTIFLVICVLLASAGAGVLIGQTGGGGSRESVTVVPSGVDTSTPVSTPVNLPPFFERVTIQGRSTTTSLVQSVHFGLRTQAADSAARPYFA